MSNKDKFVKWFEDNYDKLFDTAIKVVGKYYAGDVLNDLYLYFYDKPEINKHIIDNNKEFLYFFVSLKQFTYSPRSKFNYDEKENINIIDNILEESKNPQPLNDQIRKYQYVETILDKLYHNNIITWYNWKIFKLYFYSENYYNIDDMSTVEVFKLRKKSLRSLSSDIGISFASINYSLKKTLTILKQHI